MIQGVLGLAQLTGIARQAVEKRQFGLYPPFTRHEGQMGLSAPVERCCASETASGK